MNVKSSLKIVTLILIFSGIGFCSVPFITSLNPSDRSDANAIRIDISSIEKGQYAIITDPALGKTGTVPSYEWSLLVYRKHDGAYNIWDIPTKGALVGLPYFYWYFPEYGCLEFGPTRVNGKVDENLPIKCHNFSPEHLSFPDYQWDIEGETVAGHVESINKAKGVIEGDYFVYGKLR